MGGASRGWLALKEEGNALFQKGDFAAAADRYRAAAASGGGAEASVFTNLALALLKAKDPAGCVKASEAALALEPGNTKALHRKARGLLAQNRPEEAYECLRGAEEQELRALSSEAARAALPCAEVGPVEVRASAVHGLGLFATRDISPGEVILVERALVTVPVVDAAGRSRNWQQLGVAGVERLQHGRLAPHCGDAHRAALKRMHTPCACATQVEFYFAVWDANAHLVQDPDPRQLEGPSGVGLFPCVSRLNHSCRPNTAPSFEMTGEGDGVSATQTVRAVAPIPQGAELFASFVGLLTGRSARQAKLRGMHFEGGCRCQRCNEEQGRALPLDTLLCRCGSSEPLAATPAGVPHCTACGVQHPAAAPEELQRLVDSMETRGWGAAREDLERLSCRVPADHWAWLSVAVARAQERIWGDGPDDEDLGAVRAAVKALQRVSPPAWPPLAALRVLQAGALTAVARRSAVNGHPVRPPAEALQLLSGAVQVHHVCFGGGPDHFAARYAPELAAIGVRPGLG